MAFCIIFISFCKFVFSLVLFPCRIGVFCETRKKREVNRKTKTKNAKRNENTMTTSTTTTREPKDKERKITIFRTIQMNNHINNCVFSRLVFFRFVFVIFLIFFVCFSSVVCAKTMRRILLLLLLRPPCQRSTMRGRQHKKTVYKMYRSIVEYNNKSPLVVNPSHSVVRTFMYCRCVRAQCASE